MLAWFSAFVVTQIVEVPIYFFGALKRTRLHMAFALSLVTHPIVWFVLPPSAVLAGLDLRVAWQYWLFVAIAEAFAIGVEAILLAKVAKVAHAWAWALLANAASVSIGLASRYLYGWP